MEFRGKKISVIGAARSGLGAASVLQRLGAEALLSDSQTAAQLGTARVGEIEASGVAFVTGTSVAEALPEGTELVVTSPGVPKSAGVLLEALQRGIPVWSEIELAYRLTKVPIVATTGTNGKTTTTLLIAAMLSEAGIANVVAGNVSADEIKKTLVEATAENDHAVLVAEISSFQLEWVERFAPKVGILTNVMPDHLNRHASFEEYAQTKARLFAAQTEMDWAILNYDDPAARSLGEAGLPGRRLWFTRVSMPQDEGPAAWVQEGDLMVRWQGGAVSVLPVREMSPALPGLHSVENALAAASAALIMGASQEAVAQALRKFPGVAHRMEFVADVDGVRYINNSMCTNVAAAVASLNAMERPTLVIAGGADKGLDFSPLVPTMRAKARQLILIGTAADKMEATFRQGGYEAIRRAGTLEDAVRLAQEAAVSGDAVLLSPGCASFDMFRDFEARGAAFRRAVYALKGDA